MIITPRLRAALTTWFIRGAIKATRCAAMAQVCVFHMSQMMIAVVATGHCRTCSEAPDSLVRRRARRFSVPGTFGRLNFASPGDACAAATSAAPVGIDPRKDLRLTGSISTASS
jgi:hypothetical protein